MRTKASLAACIVGLLTCTFACTNNTNDPVPPTAAGGGTATATSTTTTTSGNSGTGGDAGTRPINTSAGPTAKEAAAAMGKGFNLGQMFENTQHPRTLEAAKAKIDAYYAKGFRTVRIPITWTEPVGGDLLVNDPAVGDVNREHARLAVIEQVVDYALSKEGMYVIINAHHEVNLKVENRAAVLERLWQEISDIFLERDHRLIYELLNEPHISMIASMPAENVRVMSTLAYAKIRAVDEKRIIVIGGNQWFAANEMARTWPTLDGVGGGSDVYLMATFHHYNPWTFCGDHQGDYADVWTDAAISDPMDTMGKWASTVGGGMPFYIGEWGVAWQSELPTMDCNNIRQWYEKFDADFAAPKGIPTMVWDDGGWFRIYNHGTDDWDNNLVDCISGDCAWNGTEQYNSACLAP